ncbi:MAG: aldehyde ferredoxin oxidoreductase N-terminal domain-containing protein, partial [Alphaproteobacteria bacterium]
MRKYLNFDLNTKTVEIDEKSGADCIRVGRHFIAKTLLERDIATIDPLSPENPLIFSAGPLAGANFSNANRISVGCKSPLTGGVKEANAGGTFAFALGQLEILGMTLNGASDEWVVIRITKDGDISYDDATPYLGKGNIEAAAMLFEAYGAKISMALC